MMTKSGIPARALRTIGRRSVLGAAAMLAGVSLLAVAPGARAQSYPDRPVRVVLPFAAGGVADATARVVAEKLSDKLGQRFVIENTPGPGGMAAARAALSGGKDGYTLAMLTNGTAVSVPLFKNLSFDPAKDFTPISNLGNFDFIFATGLDSGFKTLGDFIKAAKEKPGSINVGTIAVGSTQNLSAELLKTTAGINFQIVPYKGTPDLIVGTIRNDVQLMVDSFAAMRSPLLDKKLMALGSSGAVRSPVTPDYPTMKEGGAGEFDVSSWNALYAPAGTPDSVIQTLNKAIREVLAEEEVKKRLMDLGIEAKASSPEELAARMQADIEKWGKVIKDAKIAQQ
ncbi:MAG TPA: tripartite tricarboxylate transporter substrate-binding protein [Xanthobacteraceae bacterium]|nr:tripartite tricarboxylate transporter substrate-binding protein [Xanthobacteraceae bacterium]